GWRDPIKPRPPHSRLPPTLPPSNLATSPPQQPWSPRPPPPPRAPPPSTCAGRSPSPQAASSRCSSSPSAVARPPFRSPPPRPRGSSSPRAPPPRGAAAPAVRGARALAPAAAAGRLAPALRVPHLRLGGGRRHDAPLPARALPPPEPLHPAPRRGGARRRPGRPRRLRRRAPRARRGRERQGHREGQPRHLQGPHHGHHHAARRRHVPVGRGTRPRRRLGLVHQPLRRRLPARHAGRSHACVLQAAARSQLHRSHEQHQLESVCKGDARDHRPGAVYEDEGRSVLGTGEAELADSLQTVHRFGVDGAVSTVRGVPDLGVGEPPAHGAHVLRQLHLLAGGLLPHGGVQRRRVPQHHREQRPALHLLGQPADAAPALPHPRRLGPDARQRRALRAQVPQGRPRARPDRRRHPRAPGPRHGRARRLVRDGGGGGRRRGAEQRERSVRGRRRERERGVPAARARGRAAAEARHVAAVGGELPAEAVHRTRRELIEPGRACIELLSLARRCSALAAAGIDDLSIIRSTSYLTQCVGVNPALWNVPYMRTSCVV
ncbi:hypothetical protein U9M48_010203, partial [Paspalum notatum var. saurae]